MKKNLVLVAVLAVLLAGCAHQHPRHGRYAAMPSFNPDNPRVYVVGGVQIVVDQEPIYVPRARKDVTIVWELPADSNFVFPENAIVFNPKDLDQFKCTLEQDRKRFSCKFANTRIGPFKYTINARDGDRSLKPLDPTVVNDP